MRQLLMKAAELGVRVHGAHLPGDMLGSYSPTQRRVYFDLGLTPDERRVTIAHELGHVHYGHDCDSTRNEMQAETYAAHLLIDPAEYARAEAIDAEPNYLAAETGVTVELILHYQLHCIERIGERTYSRQTRKVLAPT